MNFEFITELEFAEEEELFYQRNSATKPMHGTVKLHVFCQYVNFCIVGLAQLQIW
jgi:hypothetical protein